MIFSSFILSLLLTSQSANSQDVCSTNHQCEQLIQQAQMKIRMLKTQYLKIGDFIRNADGSIRTGLSHFEAENICCEKNGLSYDECSKMDSLEKFKLPTHLPTVLDYAQEATFRGVKIIDSMDFQLVPGEIYKQYHPIHTYNTDGTMDKFFYNESGYVAPFGNLRKLSLWTSSFHRNDKYAARFTAENGGFVFAARDLVSESNAARCYHDVSPNK